MKVLVVDDSVVFRTQITGALSTVPGLEIVGTAANGRIALQKIAQNPVDLITLDMEMPEMDGLETLRALRSQNKTIKVIVFSSQTIRGAEKALEALREGADDVVAKPSGDSLNFETAMEAVKSALLPKVIQFTDQRLLSLKENVSFKTPADHHPARIEPRTGHQSHPKKSLQSFFPKVLVIASSTGGPPALEHIFSRLPGPYHVPVLIAQHMPPVFTQILARRLCEVTGVPAKEAVDGEVIEKNHIYVAPGDYHLRVVSKDGQLRTSLSQDAHRNSVRPAADYLFETAAACYGSNCVGAVLTGMGEDGCDGAKRVKDSNGFVLIQNKESCTVFGMPGAVFESGSFDTMGDLDFIAEQFKMILKS
jgi:two-component system chemotaxis response regulator CheB